MGFRGTYRQDDNDEVACDMQRRDTPPDIGGLAIYIAIGHVEGPVPKSREGNTSRKDRHHEPYPRDDHEDQDDLNGLPGPAVRKDPPVQQQNRYPREYQAEMVKEDAVPRRLAGAC